MAAMELPGLFIFPIAFTDLLAGCSGLLVLLLLKRMGILQGHNLRIQVVDFLLRLGDCVLRRCLAVRIGCRRCLLLGIEKHCLRVLQGCLQVCHLYIVIGQHMPCIQLQLLLGDYRIGIGISEECGIMRTLVGCRTVRVLVNIAAERSIQRRGHGYRTGHAERTDVRGGQAGIFTYHSLIVYVAGFRGHRSLGKILRFQSLITHTRNRQLAGLGTYGGGNDIRRYIKGLVFQILVYLAHSGAP